MDTPDGTLLRRPPSKASGLLYGLGLGGFVGGILLHQILQWHHMVIHRESMTTLAGLALNTLADGFFHVGTWLFVLGSAQLAIRPTIRLGRRVHLRRRAQTTSPHESDDDF